MDASQRDFFKRNGYLIIKGALSPSTVAALNATFEQQLHEEKPPSAIVWHMNRDRDAGPRKLLHKDLACPPKVAPVLRELCGSFEWGHLHPDTPADKVGSFRLDLDGAHWITPFDPAHTPDNAADFPDEAVEWRKANGLPAPFSSGEGWTPDGILQGGLHGGPPLFHVSCLYELQPVGPGDGVSSQAIWLAVALVTRRSPLKDCMYLDPKTGLQLPRGQPPRRRADRTPGRG